MAEPCASGTGAEPGRSIRGLLDVLTRRLAAATGGPVAATVWVRRRDDAHAVVAVSQAPRGIGAGAPPAASPAPAAPAQVTDTALDTAATPPHDAPSGGTGWTAPPGGAPDGPVVAVLAGGPDVLVPDVDAADAWPAWRRTARGEGFRGAAVAGAHVARVGTLALTVYLATPGAADAEVGRRVARFARQAASLVALHSTIPPRRPPARAAATAGRPRVGVQTAVGALMEARGCGEQEARRVLTVLARDQGRTLEAVAASVLEHARRPARGGPARRGA